MFTLIVLKILIFFLHNSQKFCNFALEIAYVKARVSRYPVAPRTLRLTLRSPQGLKSSGTPKII